MMKFKNLVAASAILFLLFLSSGTGFCAEDGKVTMEQWLKIINSGDAKKSTPPKTTETKEANIKGDIDSTTSTGARGNAVTVYWHMADDADVYLNGKPLRHYEPSFKTRPDEAPKPAFAASAIIRKGDVFTVGGRRGGSFGFMLIAVDSAGKVVFQSNQQSWKVYEPGDRTDWYNPQVAMSSPTQPVTVQPDPWYPQKELNAKYGNKALSIWSTPANTFAYLYGVVGGDRKTADRTIDAAPKVKAGTNGAAPAIADKGDSEEGDLSSRSGGSTSVNPALKQLAGTKAVYKNTLADVYMTATFSGTGVSVVCQSPDGKGRRTFDGSLLSKAGRPDVVTGQATYQGEASGEVSYSFDVAGDWANAIWSPRGRDVQWSRWIRINEAEKGGQR